MQSLDFKQESSTVTRPLLSQKSKIVLSTNSDIRFDYVQRAANEIDGLNVIDGEVDEFSTIVFGTDRVAFDQIDEFIDAYYQISQVNLYDERLSVTSTLDSEGKISGFDTVARGQRLKSYTVMEIYTDSSISSTDVENALTFTGKAEDFGVKSDIQLTNPTAVRVGNEFAGNKYIVTPKFNKKFLISDKTVSTPYIKQAISDLGISDSNIVFASQVVTVKARDMLD